MTSPLPSPPTSPTSPRPATARIRIKRHDSPSTPTSAGPAERTRTPSQSLSRIVIPEGSEARTAVANKRRQSSITYYTPSSPSPWNQRPQLTRSLSSGGDVRDAEPVVVNGKENVSKRSSLVLSSRSASARESVSSLDAAATREREPLTLVEKYADLLRFIAQKERKCLELRDQLAAHEKELAELKYEWERVVNRRHDPLSNPPSTAGIGGAAFDGLKEGVRIIAAGFSELGGVIHELETATDNDSPKTRPLTHMPRNSNASNSRMNSEHLSTSSMSSIQECMHASDHILDGEGEIMTMAVTIATAPSLARASSLDSRVHKRAMRAICTEPTTPTISSTTPPGSPQPANLDVGMSLVLTPSPTLVPPLLGALPTLATPAPKSPEIRQTHRPVSMAARPVSSWMDSVGKKLSELHKGETFSKSQKRASSLLAGVSNTISSALLPGPTATTPAPLPDLSLTTSPVPTKVAPPAKRGSPSRPPLRLRPRPQSESRSYPSYRSMADWLEDDEEQTVHAGGMLTPDSKLPAGPDSATGEAEGGDGVDTATTAMSSFDDEWNW